MASSYIFISRLDIMYSHKVQEQSVSVGNIVERKKVDVVPYAKQASVIDSNVSNRNKDFNVLLHQKCWFCNGTLQNGACTYQFITL